MSEEEAREVRAKLTGITGPAEKYSLTQFTINIAVNAIPSIDVKGNRVTEGSLGSAQPVDDGASDVSVPDLIAWSSQEQNRIWAAKKPPILELEVINDGKGNNAKMRGFCTSPQVSIGGTKVVETRQLIHQDYALSDMDMSIYDFNNEPGTEEYNPPMLTDPNPEEPVCAYHLLSLFKWILTSGEFDRRHLRASPEATATYVDIDNLNKGELFPQVLYPILRKSVDTALKASAAGGKLQHHTYRSTLLRTILSGSNVLSFLQNWLCPNFMFQHVANWDVAPGKSYFQHARNNEWPERTEFLDMTQCHIEMGEQLNMGTIGQCEFMTKSASEWGDQGAGTNNNSGNVSENILCGGAWPVKKIPKWGRLERFELPPWGMYDHTPYEEQKVLDSVVMQGPTREGIAEAKKTRARIAQRGQEHISTFSVFLMNWAKKKYTIEAIKEAMVTIEMPLDISWGCDEWGDGNLSGSNPKSVGYVYSIYEAGSGEFMFDGYLNNVTHNVVLGEKDGRATTTLVFINTKGPFWRSGTGFTPKYGCAPWVLPEL